MGAPLTVTQAQIHAFANLSGDHQWIHVDQERCARESPVETSIAHGALTIALLPRLIPRPGFTIVGHRNALNYGIDNLRFLAPAPAGEAMHAAPEWQRTNGARREPLVKTAVRVQRIDATASVGRA